MNKRDLCDSIIARGITRRSDPYYQKVYDYRRVPDNQHVVRALQAYDRHLFVRFNCATERWELARWRSHTVPSVLPVSDEEKCNRSFTICTVENLDGSYRPVDWRLYKRAVHGDPWRKFGSVNSMARQMDEADRQAKIREDAEVDRMMDDWADDNKFQIRSFINRGRIISTARPGVA